MTDLTERLRNAARKLRGWAKMALATDPETVTGSTLLYEEAADWIATLTARLAEAEARVAELDNSRAAAEIAGDALESQLRVVSLERDAIASEPKVQATSARELRERLAEAEAEVDRLLVAMASLGDWCDGSDRVSVHVRNTAWQFISASRSRMAEAAKGGRDE